MKKSKAAKIIERVAIQEGKSVAEVWLYAGSVVG